MTENASKWHFCTQFDKILISIHLSYYILKYHVPTSKNINFFIILQKSHVFRDFWLKCPQNQTLCSYRQDNYHFLSCTFLGNFLNHNMQIILLVVWEKWLILKLRLQKSPVFYVFFSENASKLGTKGGFDRFIIHHINQCLYECMIAKYKLSIQ